MLLCLTGTGFMGYVGVLSGVRAGHMSLTLNTRMMGKPMLQMFTIILDSIKMKVSGEKTKYFSLCERLWKKKK